MFIVGIEPRAPGIHVFKKNFMPRLGLPRLFTMAEAKGHNCEIYCEEIAPIDWDRVAKAELICISSITSTAPRAYEIIKKIREVNSKAPILGGGSHWTFLPEEALDNGVDYVFRHGADDTFMQWLYWYGAKELSDLNKIQALSFKVASEYVHTDPQPNSGVTPPIVDLDKLPAPNLSLISGYYPLTIPISGSEGCPHKCKFCSERKMHGIKYHFRSVDNIIADIKYYVSQYGRNVHIFFVDDNAGAKPVRLRDLCEALIENDLILDYSAQVRLDLAKYAPDLLPLMRKAGFSRICIGYETTNEDSLKEANKGLTYVEMISCTKAFHAVGIAIHSMWIVGFDHDNLKTIKDIVAFCIRHMIETMQILFLVPLPGSDIYEEYKNQEGRIFNFDWSKYDGQHVVFNPAKIEARQLQVTVIFKALPKVYNLGQTLRIFLSTNFQIFLRSLRGKKLYPRQEFKTNLTTLGFRLWGLNAIRSISKNIKAYLAQKDVWQKAEELAELARKNIWQKAGE